MNELSPADVYYYPRFTKGKVFFKDGTKSEAKLNYSNLLDEIQFINAKGDTLGLADEVTINYIAVEKDSFYFDKGYVRLLAGNNLIRLAVKQIWTARAIGKKAGYDAVDPLASISSYNAYIAFGTLYNLSVNEDTDLTKAEQYFFGNKDNHFLPAGKKNLFILFPEQRKQLEKYLRENNINYGDKDDLMKLISFFTQL